jgi:hypothetical protein
VIANSSRDGGRPPYGERVALDIHVTSRGIEHAAVYLDDHLLSTFTKLRGSIADTDVASPGFSAFGNAVFGGAYADAQRASELLLDEAIEAIQDCHDTLMVCARNWRVAEDKNIVRYQ